MRFPITEEEFMFPPYCEKEAYKENVKLYVAVMNMIYEFGKESKDSGFFINKEFVKEWLEMVFDTSIEREADLGFINIIMKHANEAYQQGVRDSGTVFDIPFGIIKILPCFAEHPPKEKIMQRKRLYYADTGLLQSEIILDSGNHLIDGYASYLVAQENGLDTVPVQYRERQIIKGSHKTGGELYTWELPGLLIGHVAAGDKVIVQTRRGVRTVTVAAVGPYNPEEYPETLLWVIRKRHKWVAI